MVDIFHGEAFPVRIAGPRKPQGQRDVPPGAPPPVDIGPWTRTAQARPTSVHGGQVDVLFGSADWGWAIVGLYTHWSEEEVAAGAVRWAMYDQGGDTYVDYFEPGEDEPEFWMAKPLLPSPVPVEDQGVVTGVRTRPHGA